jgi:hypothetical protein
MAIAAFDILKCTGTDAGTEADSGRNPCFLSADLNSTDTSSYPIAVPDSGSNYSYEVRLRWKCTTAPDNKCENFKYYGASSQPVVDVTIMAGADSGAHTPSDSASSYATTAQHNNYYSSGTALTFDDSTEITAINDKTDTLVLQLKVESDAPQGALPTMPQYVEYDEY